MSKGIFAVMLVASIGLLHYCKSNSKDVQNIAQESQHSSQQSLDWDGTYRGVLPCADCQGTQITIYLTKSLSYRLQVKYLGKSDSVYDQTGVFSWNKEGNTITLHNQPKPNSFFVSEGRLTKLDVSGNKITGSLAPKYILTKQK